MNAIGQLLAGLRRLLTWWVIVAPWEQALRVRLGKRVALLHAGFYFQIPFIDRVYRQSTRKRISVMSTQTVSSKDGKTITVCGQLGYSIRDLVLLYETLHHPEDTVESMVYALISEFIGSHYATECTADAIGRFATDGLNLDEYGLENAAVQITDLAVVRTYRLITGEGFRGRWGDKLDTNRHVESKYQD